jgi:4-hydroxy-2-oxoheptanedioate aldolase
MARAGYDWTLVDLEHGAGGEREALFQIQAASGAGAIPVVRIESIRRQRAHRVLDLGAQGIMFPHIDNAEAAQHAVAAMRYPPDGVRGVAFSNRACHFGSNFRQYVDSSRETLLGIMQIESPEAVANANEIAATDGVDVLFVGPSDLSHSLGILGQFENPLFCNAVDKVANAAAKHGKFTGILLPKPEEFDRFWKLGFRFIASGSDGVLLNNAARALVGRLRDAHRSLSLAPV